MTDLQAAIDDPWDAEIVGDFEYDSIRDKWRPIKPEEFPRD